VVFGMSLDSCLAFDLPNDSTRFPPPCALFIIQNNSSTQTQRAM